MKIGIVGNEEKKFTNITEKSAKSLIRRLLNKGDILVSGHCHLGGIDIWAEEIAKEIGCYDVNYIYPPKNKWWEPNGYKERNLKIARESDVLYNISVSEYPPDFKGRKFKNCYHCKTNDHIKSGGCWTAKKARESYIYIIYPDGSIKDRMVV